MNYQELNPLLQAIERVGIKLLPLLNDTAQQYQSASGSIYRLLRLRPAVQWHRALRDRLAKPPSKGTEKGERLTDKVGLTPVGSPSDCGRIASRIGAEPRGVDHVAAARKVKTVGVKTCGHCWVVMRAGVCVKRTGGHKRIKRSIRQLGEQNVMPANV